MNEMIFILELACEIIYLEDEDETLTHMCLAPQ